MPSVAVTITMDKTQGTNTWLVRVFDRVEDVETEIPSDTWEAHWIQADADTIEHLEDRLLVETMKKRHNMEVKNHVATAYEIPGEDIAPRILNPS